MLMLYNSDNYAVVQIDLPAATAGGSAGASQQGGYEIVDKFARKEIFISGAMAESFKSDVQELIERSPSEEEVDEYLARFASLMQNPLVLH